MPAMTPELKALYVKASNHIEEQKRAKEVLDRLLSVSEEEPPPFGYWGIPNEIGSLTKREVEVMKERCQLCGLELPKAAVTPWPGRLQQLANRIKDWMLRIGL
jgi:hypothetical protein